MPKCGYNFRTPSNRDEKHRSRKTCPSCIEESMKQHALESNPFQHLSDVTINASVSAGSKRPTAPPRSPDAAGLTPSSARSQPYSRIDPPSPTPVQREPSPLVPPRRSTRTTRPPRRPLDTQPTLELVSPSPPPPPRVNRHEGQRRCSHCHAWKGNEHFASTFAGSGIPTGLRLAQAASYRGEANRHRSERKANGRVGCREAS